MFRTLGIVLAFVVMSILFASAQPQRADAPAKVSNSPTLAELKVTGSTRFDQKRLVAAVGLKIGEAVTEQQMREAADRLASSGMFDDVTYQYVQRPAGTAVEFKVSDTAKLLPMVLDNFVWLPRAQLVEELKSRESLFSGEIPNQGQMFEQLAAHMEKILKAQNVAGTVKALPLAPETGGTLLGFIFTVEGVKLPIQSMEIAGTSAEMQPVLQKIIAGSLLGSDYAESRVQAFQRLDLLPQYRMRGFLKAEFRQVSGELADQSTGSVTVKASVTEGLQYKLAELRWAGNAVVSSSELDKVLRGKTGAPANAVQLEEDLHNASKAYDSRGYLEARLEPVPTLEDNSQTVRYVVTVTEGPQYHMGNLAFEGLTEAPAEALRKLWTLKTGAPFDSSYPNQFFQNASRQFNFSRVDVQIRDIPHRDSKTVDVSIRFAPRQK